MNWKKISTIATHEYLTNVKRPSFIIVTLIFPALGLVGLVIAAFFSGQAATFFTSQFPNLNKPVGVVDHAALYTPIAASFQKRYVEFQDEDSARQALTADRVGAFIVIPSDYITTGQVVAYSKSSFTAETLEDSNSLRSLLTYGLLKGKVDEATRVRVTSPYSLTKVTIDSAGKVTSGSGSDSFLTGTLAPYLLSVFLIVAIFVSSNYLLRSVSEEKETRIIEIIISSVAPTELLAGKVLGLGALGLTQALVWLGSGFALSGGLGALFVGATILLNPVAFALAGIYFILGFLVYGITMAAAGSLGTSQRESQQIAGIFSFFAAIPYMIASFLFADPNILIARILSFFPFTAPTMMMLRLPMGQVPAIDIIASLIILIVSVPFLGWLGAKVFRMGILIYGKRPSVKEIWRALRAA
ncbi:MAG TPA: ABC transporter permease [Anaerolineae bacterium]